MQYSQLEHHESIRKLSSVNKGLFSKVVQIYVYKIDENSDLFLFPTKARFPNPKTSSIRGCLSSSRSKQSERRTHPQH